MKSIQHLIGEARKVYELYWESYLNGDTETLSSLLDDHYSQIGSVEEEVFFNKKDALKFVFDTIDQVAGKLEMRNRKTKHDLFEEFILLYELCDLYVLIDNEWTFYSRFRATSLLQEKPDGWKIVHQHSSLPDSKAQEGENIAIRKISEENIELRDAIKRRTIELENKNRDLEVEAGLERVRAQAMSMRKSEDLITVVEILYGQLRNLGFQFGIASIVIMDHDTGDMDCWNQGFGDGYDLPEYYHVPFFEHPAHLQQLEQWKSGIPYAEIEVSGQEKKTYDAYYFSHTDFSRAPESTKQLMMQQESIRFSMAFMKYGALSWSPTPLSNEQPNILERFAKVFEQCYTRFLDLQNAEAQAREAKIEAALERVRSKAMSMQHSIELSSLISVVYAELTKLDISFDRCFIMLFDPETFGVTWWMASPEAPQLTRGFKLPFHQHAPHIAYVQGWKERKEKWEYVAEGEEKRNWDDYIFSATELSGLPEAAKAYMKSVPRICLSASFNSFGCLTTGSNESLTQDAFNILIRFSRVFDICYTRFNDLKQAEAQAREAQIQLALERVRARTMAMQKSEELADAAQLLYQQFRNLNLSTLACAYIFIQEEKNLQRTWTVLPDGTLKLDFIDFPLTGDPILNKRYEAWQKKNPLHRAIVERDENKAHHHFLASRVPAEVDTEIFSHLPDKIIFYSANFSHGYLHILAPELFTEAEERIVIRFAKVFEQTYTRFLDLKKAEAQTREAQIEAALERIRAKALAMHQSNELMEVALTLREQMGLLGQKELEASVIQFFNLKKETIHSWHVLNTPGSVKGDLSAGSFEIRKDTCQLTQKFFTEYQSEKTEFSIVAEGKILWEWLEYLKSISPELNESIQDFRPERAFFHFSKFSEGALLMVSSVPVTEESKYLQKRAAQVFELAYKRYKDLMQAEKLARKAANDLIRLKVEKKRTDDALKELKSTQAQLIQSEKMASLGELTAGIAHEIQNPLNFVNNFSEVSVELVGEIEEERAKSQALRQSSGTKRSAAEKLEDVILKDIKENLEKIIHHGKRADAIVKGMLEHSRTSTGVKVLTDINALAEEYLRLSYYGMKAKDKSFNADFSTDFDPNLPKINVIPQDIGRVLLNVINNAFQACATPAYPEGRPQLPKGEESQVPIVKVSTSYSPLHGSLGGRIEISISDNGPGIPDSIKDKIFQPFFTTKPSGQGTGLGLSLSYDIIKAHGGSIEVQSIENEGSVFTVILPV